MDADEARARGLGCARGALFALLVMVVVILLVGAAVIV
jgi:hypothetical protein